MKPSERKQLRGSTEGQFRFWNGTRNSLPPASSSVLFKNNLLTYLLACLLPSFHSHLGGHGKGYRCYFYSSDETTKKKTRKTKKKKKAKNNQTKQVLYINSVLSGRSVMQIFFGINIFFYRNIQCTVLACRIYKLMEYNI